MKQRVSLPRLPSLSSCEGSKEALQELALLKERCRGALLVALDVEARPRKSLKEEKHYERSCVRRW